MNDPESLAVRAGGVGDQKVGIAGSERFPDVLHVAERLHAADPQMSQGVAHQAADIALRLEQDALDLA